MYILNAINSHKVNIMSKGINQMLLNRDFMEYFHIEKHIVCLYNVTRLDLDTIISSFYCDWSGMTGCFRSLGCEMAESAVSFGILFPECYFWKNGIVRYQK